MGFYVSFGVNGTNSGFGGYNKIQFHTTW